MSQASFFNTLWVKKAAIKYLGLTSRYLIRLLISRIHPEHPESFSKLPQGECESEWDWSMVYPLPLPYTVCARIGTSRPLRHCSGTKIKTYCMLCTFYCNACLVVRHIIIQHGGGGMRTDFSATLSTSLTSSCLFKHAAVMVGHSSELWVTWWTRITSAFVSTHSRGTKMFILNC